MVMEYSALSSVPKLVPTIAKATGSDVHTSGVSWAAVFGGAFVIAALSLILLALGAGLGLSAMSPWANAGASAKTIGAAAICWLILIQLVPSAMGGFLAGRLRQRWPSLHTDEVYFRDTAHGFLAWAAAIVMTAAFLATAATSLAGGAMQASGNAAGVAAVSNRDINSANPTAADSNAYFTDMLLRSTRTTTDVNDAPLRAETARILSRALGQTDIPAADRTYLTQVVAERTGLSSAEAEQRVGAVISQARDASQQELRAVDVARRAAAHVSLWVFVALLVGAFSASLAATIGGAQRDRVVVL